MGALPPCSFLVTDLAVTTMKYAKMIKTIPYRSSRAPAMTALGLQAEELVRQIRDSLPISYPQWRPHVARATHLGTAQSVSTLED